MNPQEIQKQSFESSKTPEKKETKTENNNLPKSATLSKYPNFDMFVKTLNTLDNETKNKLLSILASIPEDELTMYIEMEADNSNLITEDDIKRFITEKDIYTKKGNFGINDVVKDNDNTQNKDSFAIADTTNTISQNQDKKENEKNSKDQFQQLGEKLSKLKLTFGENPEILKTLNNLENLYNDRLKLDPNDTKHFEKTKEIREKIQLELNNYFSNKENAKEFFQTLNEKNPALYEETYNAVVAISPKLREQFTTWGIPSEPYTKVEKLDGGKSDDKTIISQFPGAKPEDIEKRGDLVSYGDKTIDLKNGKAYISGEGGYAIETSMKVPNSLDVRVYYQKERLEILDEIKTNEKILNLLENKASLKEKLEILKNEKSGNIGDNLPINIEIHKIEVELQKIDEKLKQAVPGYKEDQDEAFQRFLNYKIEQSKEKLTNLKTKFDADMQQLLQAGQDEIASRDEKVRETISFLNDLGITNINQNDLQKIINRINITPQAYGFSKAIDLKKGFEGEATDILKQKREFFNFFAKMYEKIGLTNPPVSMSIIEGRQKDPRLKNDTLIKQSLENTGITYGGSLQIETFFTLINEKPEKKQNTPEN